MDADVETDLQMCSMHSDMMEMVWVITLLMPTGKSNTCTTQNLALMSCTTDY